MPRLPVFPSLLPVGPLHQGGGAFAQPGIGMAGALLAGATAALWAPWAVPWPAAVAAFVAGVWGWWMARGRTSWLCAAALFLCGGAWASLYAGWTLERNVPPALEGREVQVAGRIVDLPDHQARRTRFLLAVASEPATPPALRGRRLQVAWYDDYGAQSPGPRMQVKGGERWRLRLRVRAPRGLANPGGYDAERQALALHLAGSGTVRAPDTASRLAPASGLTAWREGMAARIAQVVPDGGARFVQALALGDTRQLDDRDWERLRAVGLTHLIAISGSHVGMVGSAAGLLAGGVWWALPGLGRRMPRPQAMAIVALAGAAVYAGVAGFALPTVRTVLMIAVAALARVSRRRCSVADALALALIVLLLVDPLGLLTAGFWLSFAGVAWLVWCLPGGGGTPGWRGWLRGFLSAQGVATVGLLPLTVALFGQASVAGPLANLLAIPWWSLVVVPLSLLGLVLEAVVPGTGAWAWQLADRCFAPSWALFARLADSPAALWWLPESGTVALLLAMAGAFWLMLPRGIPARPVAVLLWLPMLWPRTEAPPPGGVDLHVLDVGQGLAVVVRTAGHTLLYDTGPALPEGFDAGERVVVPALHALARPRLDAVVVSHGDSDHAGGLEAVRRAFVPARLLAPAGSPVAGAEACLAGQGWTWDGVRFRFLHPGDGFPYLGNESSCVLRVETAGGALLFTGDIGEVIEARLLRSAAADLRAEVVVVPHHGSGGASTPGLVAATGTRLALLSTGHGNRFGHPRPAVVQRWQRAGAETLDTAASGAVRVWLGPRGLQVRERRRWRPHLWDAVAHAEAARGAAILSAGIGSASWPEDLRRVGTGQGRRLADGAVGAAGRAGAGNHPGTPVDPAP